MFTCAFIIRVRMFLFYFHVIVYINGSLQYLMKYNLAPVFTKPEFEHWFTPQPGIVDSYVVEVNLCT